MDEAGRIGVATREEIAGLSGLEMLQAMIEGRLPSAPIGATMGFRLVEVAPGRSVFEAVPGPHLLNPLGGSDRVFGGDGDDRLSVRDGVTDLASGGAGTDTITRDAIDDVVA